MHAAAYSTKFAAGIPVLEIVLDTGDKNNAHARTLAAHEPACAFSPDFHLKALKCCR